MNDLLGKRLGDFEVLRELGRGGMGIVYEARQVSLKRRVALKVLGGAGLTAKSVQRFHREAEAAAKLHHSNIVAVFATGEENYICFYAMELIDGPSLDQVIKRIKHSGGSQAPVDQQLALTADLPSADSIQTSPNLADDSAPGSSAALGRSALRPGSCYFDDVARLMADVADALDYAHKNSVIHRDIKPSNLLLSPEGRLSINDFGLARILEEPGMTTTGEFIGTPAYMSPEQVTAGRVPLDHRTDVYSLGATLYELLTLQPPFAGESREQVLAQILHKDPRPPRKENRRVPLDLDTICVKAMEKDPDRRYQTAGEMADDLRRFVNRHAISARRAGPAIRLKKWVRRRPALAAALAVAIVALGAALGFAYYAYLANLRSQQIELQLAQDAALLEAMSGNFEAAQSAIQKAELLGVSKGWVRMLRGLVDLQRNETAKAIENLEQAVRLLPNSTAARSILSRALVENGNWERHFDELRACEMMACETPEDSMFLGWAQTHALPSKALPALNQAIQRRDTSVARLMRAQTRAFYAIETGRIEDAQGAVEDARVARAMLPKNPTGLANHLLALLVTAIIYQDLNKEEDRQAALKEAGELAKSLLPFKGLAAAYRTRALYFDAIGRIDLATEEYERQVRDLGVSVETAVYGSAALFRARKLDKCLEMLDRMPPDKEPVMQNLFRAFVLADRGAAPAEVVAVCRQAEERAKSGIMATYPQFVFRLLGMRSEAVEASKRARHLVSQLPDWIQPWYLTLNDFNCGTLTADQLTKIAGSSRLALCEAHFFIAMDLLSLGDRKGALQHFRKSWQTNVVYFIEYHWGKAFAARLEADPTWPPWIPAGG